MVVGGYLSPTIRCLRYEGYPSTPEIGSKQHSMTQPLIGILAGMGPRSTAPFIDLVVTECQKQYGARDDIDFPKMMICSQPAPFYEDHPTDHTALEAAIREGLQDLERTGADFLAIACNTAHIYYPSLAKSVNVPLLNIVDLAVADIPEEARRVALVAARPTVEAGIYQAGLRGRGFEVAEIGWQAQIDHLLAVTRTSTDPLIFTQLWHDLIAQAEAAQADTILVACLDLSGIIRYAPTQLAMRDAAQSLAQEIVRELK
jgi:aspartate racemase